MSERSTGDGHGSGGLKCLFYSSDDGRSFSLIDAQQLSFCLVHAGSVPDRDALIWLESFLKERFNKVFCETSEGGEKRSLVTFLQSAHADLFRERARWPRGLADISLAAAHLREDTIEIASVGTCAAYRLAPSVAERIIPSEGNGADSCYLGACLKVSVEMVRRSLAQGIEYVLTSRRVDLSPSWGGTLVEALKLAITDSGSALRLLFGTEGGAFGTLESGELSRVEVSRGEAPETDNGWYKKLREELAGVIRGQGAPGVKEPEKEATQGPTLEFSGRKKRFPSSLTRILPVAAVALIVGIAIYVFLARGGGQWARVVLSSGRSEKEAITARKTFKSALSLSSIPPGAEILVDDSTLAPRTPALLASVAPGNHHVTMRLGGLGEWAGSVAVQPGDTADLRVAFLGEIAVDSRPEDGLSVILDGEPRGYTPCTLESVAVGMHVVRIEGKGVSPWEEEVLVTQGNIAQVQVTPGKLPQTGQVQITAGRVSEEGYEESRGRGVFIDKMRVGATPLRRELKPGFHSIRVTGSKGESPSVTVIQVRPGGKHFIRAEFTGVQPILVECAETRAPSSGQIIICASLSGNTEAEISRAELYIETPDSNRGGWKQMALVPGSYSVYAAGVPEDFSSAGRQVKYFVRVTTSDGLEYFSEVGALVTR